MKGQPPWTYEDTNLGEGWISSETIVQFFVAGLLEATSDGSNLKDLWIKEALMWAVESSSRHLSCRSFQVQIHLLRCFIRLLGSSRSHAETLERSFHKLGSLFESLFHRTIFDFHGMCSRNSRNHEGLLTLSSHSLAYYFLLDANDQCRRFQAHFVSTTFLGLHHIARFGLCPYLPLGFGIVALFAGFIEDQQ